MADSNSESDSFSGDTSEEKCEEVGWLDKQDGEPYDIWDKAIIGSSVDCTSMKIKRRYFAVPKQ